ncbi:hypothetical protein MRX96_012325 [Rhipicephalus microplus]
MDPRAEKLGCAPRGTRQQRLASNRRRHASWLATKPDCNAPASSVRETPAPVSIHIPQLALHGRRVRSLFGRSVHAYLYSHFYTPNGLVFPLLSEEAVLSRVYLPHANMKMKRTHICAAWWIIFDANCVRRLRLRAPGCNCVACLRSGFSLDKRPAHEERGRQRERRTG